MKERKEEYKRRKKAYKKEKRRYVTLWKSLGLAFLVLSLVLTLVGGAALVFDHVTALVTGDSLWTLSQADAQAVYFTSDYETQEDWQTVADALQQQIGMEGLVLLKNADNTLPLVSGASLRLEGDRSGLQTALQQVGFVVTAESDIAVVVVSAATEQGYLEALAEQKTAGQLQRLILLVTADANPALWQQFPADGVLHFPVWSDELAAQTLAGQNNPAGSLAAPMYLEQAQDWENMYRAAVIAEETTDYTAQVVYPLGWGLHYTAFDYSAPKITYEKEMFTATVDVTNRGAAAGKEILQLYAVDTQGKLNLVGFGKTDILEAGACETVTITVAAETFAQARELAAGDYFFIAAANAHEAANHYLAALGHTPETTEGRMDGAGNPDMVAKWTQSNIQKLYNSVDMDQDRTKAPVVGAKNGIKLQTLRGIDFHAPQWQQLLDQLTFWDMASMVTNGNFYLHPATSVNAPGCRVDNGVVLPWEVTQEPIDTMLETTWNCDLAYEQGKLTGDWYLNRGIYMVGTEQAGLCSAGDGFVNQTLAYAQAAGMGEKGIMAAGVDEKSPAFGTWQEELAGVSICNDLFFLPAVIELSQKETDTQTLWALRDACHRNLYALANSAAMNTMGTDTVVVAKTPLLVLVLMIGAAVSWALFIVFAVFWGKGKAKWKRTLEYLDFKTLKRAIRQSQE